MSEVYQIKEDIFESWLKGAFISSKKKELTYPDDYELVARIDSDDLSVIFELTNTIDHPWYENQDIEVVKKSRSTSPGDIFVLSTGVHCLCLPIGWKKYPAPPVNIPSNLWSLISN